MKRKCNCGADLGEWQIAKCIDCEERQQKQVIWFVIGCIALFFGIVLGVRLLWANFVYDDWRCAIGECRIIKEN